MRVDLSAHADFSHLTTLPAVGTRFGVTVSVLRRLRGLNAFDLPWRDARGRAQIDAPRVPVVFALRGACLADPSALTAQGERIELAVAAIDHETPCSVICVTRGARIWAFKGSTVPHADYLARQIGTPREQIACQLPTGRYLCRRGTHGRGRRRISNALILSRHETVIVQRRRQAPVQAGGHFAVDTPLDELHPATNLHAARTQTPRAHHSTFASAGCLTVPGTNRTGPWRSFVQQVAGRRRDRREVILLTGAEACLAAHDTPDVPRIRPGSMRTRIMDLQRLLRVTVDGRLGKQTAEAALARWGTWNVPAADVPPSR